MEDKINFSVSKELKKKLEKKSKESSFDSVEEYIIFILEQVVSEEDEREEIYTKEDEEAFNSTIGNEDQKTDEEDPYSEQDEEKLKKHLEDKGYV